MCQHSRTYPVFLWKPGNWSCLQMPFLSQNMWTIRGLQHVVAPLQMCGVPQPHHVCQNIQNYQVFCGFPELGHFHRCRFFKRHLKIRGSTTSCCFISHLLCVNYRTPLSATLYFHTTFEQNVISKCWHFYQHSQNSLKTRCSMHI